VIGYGMPVSLVLRVTDFNLTQPGGTGSGTNPNAGHIEVFVDGSLAAIVSDLTVVLPLDSGSHEIRTRLVQDDGTPLSPDVSAFLTVLVTHGPETGIPTIAITYPENDAARGADTSISFRIANFSLVTPGRPVAPNEGHIEIYLDGELYAELTDYEPAHFSDLGDGDHTVVLQLVDGAHNPLVPDASASVRFHVTEAHVVDINPQFAVGIAVLVAAIMAVLLWPRRKPG